MVSFETVTVSTDLFLELTLIKPLFIVALLYLAFTIFDVIFYKFTTKSDNTGYAIHFSYAYFLLFKGLIYLLLAFMVFFFDFPSLSWHPLKFPKEMPLSSAFVGVLAAYEAISSLISSFHAFLEK